MNLHTRNGLHLQSIDEEEIEEEGKRKKNKSTYLIKTHPLLIFYIESTLLLDSAKKNGLFIVQRDAEATAKQR